MFSATKVVVPPHSRFRLQLRLVQVAGRSRGAVLGACFHHLLPQAKRPHVRPEAPKLNQAFGFIACLDGVTPTGGGPARSSIVLSGAEWNSREPAEPPNCDTSGPVNSWETAFSSGDVSSSRRSAGVVSNCSPAFSRFFFCSPVGGIVCPEAAFRGTGPSLSLKSAGSTQ